MKSYNEDGDIGYFLEVDVEYPKDLCNSHKDLPFLPERQKIEKVVKLACDTNDKEKYVIHIATLKQALNHGLVLKEVHRVIQFKQKAWTKKDIDKNTKLRKKANNEFEKKNFKLMNNSVLGKTMENVRKHSDIKSVTTEEQRSKLVSEPNYHTTKHFTENLLGIEIKRTKVTMKKPLYLGMTILDISKILKGKFWYDYIKPKYADGAKQILIVCYTDTDSFIIHIFTEDFFEDIAGDIKRWFDTSNYDENDKRP